MHAGSSRSLLSRVLILVVLVATGVRARHEEAPHYRAFWVDTFNTALNTHSDILTVVAGARAARANAILAQVRRRGDAWYLRSLEPLPDSPQIERDFDPLDDLIVEAHAAGIAVHAFVIVGAVWNSLVRPSNPNHLFNRHGLAPSGRAYDGRDQWLTRTLLPDGAATSVSGYRVGAEFWIEPGHPDAAAHTVEVLLHLVRNYDIDGLHLDRIRYPELGVPGQTPSTGVSTGYNETNVSRFQRRHGIAAGSPAPAHNDPRWSQWRRDQVTNLVRRIYLSALAIKPRLSVSAALITFGNSPLAQGGWEGSEPYWRVFQDWRAWMEEGILDLAIPMNYKREHSSAEREAFGQWAVWTSGQQHNRAALIGLGAFLNGIEGTLGQIRRVLPPSSGGNSLGGVAFFSMARTNEAVAANPLSMPPGRNTPRRSFADFAAALTTGRSADGAERLDPSIDPVPVFAGGAEVPALPWKMDPQVGHLMGIIRDKGGAAVDAADVTIDRMADAGAARAGRTRVVTATDGNGFYGGVDLAPGSYRVTVIPARQGAFTSGCEVMVARGRVASLDLFIDPARLGVARCVATRR